MSLWRQLTRGGRVLSRRGAADDDLSDELRHYMDQAVAELVARGVPEDKARRTAQLEIGNMTVAREQVRSYGWENFVLTAGGDLRYALRRLRRNPGFTAVAAITLAVGIGASTAIFSAVNPVLFRALPYPTADRLAVLTDRSSNGTPTDVAFGNYREIAARARSFESSAAFKAWQPTLVGEMEPERLSGERVGAGFFRTLGITPAMGRDFQPDDDRPGGPNVVILSDALWRRRFGGDRAIVGRSIKLDDQDNLVIGVMPPSFENVVAPLAQIWAPLQYASVFGPDDREWGHHLRVVARLRPGASLPDAAREIDRIARSPIAEFGRVPWARMENGFSAHVAAARSDSRHQAGDARRARRRLSRAGDRLRQRHQFAAGARSAAARRIRHARRTRRRARPTDATTPHGKRAAGRDRWSLGTRRRPRRGSRARRR